MAFLLNIVNVLSYKLRTAVAELHQPLAIAVIGGFLISLPLLLIFLPTMLRLLYRNYKPHEMDET